MEHSSFEIQLKGVVQGVGFRPFIFNLAKNWNLVGHVNNGNEGVKIVINCNDDTASQFLAEILKNPPKFSRITNSSLKEIAIQPFIDFQIVESSNFTKNNLLLTPDFSICPDCASELNSPNNRRFQYPFITCTACGPRYSIVDTLPFDRHQTTMSDFEMCDECLSEYQDPNNRRFYSQTNSCPACGIKLKLYEVKEGESREILTDSHLILEQLQLILEAGKIVAVKGIGGYLLLCDATNEAAINTLRARKYRPSKPFAVLFPNLAEIQKSTNLKQTEFEVLSSEIAPIVLLEKKSKNNLTESIAPKLSKVGVMLPYTGILQMIVSSFGKPLVATSGNVSGNPIVYEDLKAISDLASISDFILTNNRKIHIPQDDSVIRFSNIHNQKIIIRRSRGMDLDVWIKPEILRLTNQKNSIAFGASMKSTFTLLNQETVYVSQYLGDVESYETQENFKTVMSHFLKIFRQNDEPEINKVYCDAHEGYASTQLAIEYSKHWNVPLQKIQHHQAHFAAVLSENDLLECNEPILGVIWDGTGYGSDNQIWGGEFLKFENKTFERLAHFPYFDALLADKMPRQPRLSALSLLYSFSNDSQYLDRLKSKFTEREWDFYNKALLNNKLKTSSIGRLFDGFASIIGLIDNLSYEGEAAMLVEDLAASFFKKNSLVFEESYFDEIEFRWDEVFKDIDNQKTKEWLSAKFHYSLVQYIKFMANQLGIKRLAFSGGVFQNAVLVDLIIEYLKSSYELYFHKNLSPNDECISYGQTVIGILETQFQE